MAVTQSAENDLRRDDLIRRLRDLRANYAVRARGNLDRHGVHFLTAYVAGV